MPFDVERYQMLRRSTALGVRVRHREVTESTMDDARAGASEGDLPGTAYVAAQQTAGRGREGRSWVSEPGAGLWVTYFLEVPPPGALVSIAAGLAVTDAIEATAGLECVLKWPNDVQHSGRKLCGILAEATTVGGDSDVMEVYLGIGINLRTPEGMPADVLAIATSIEQEGRPAPAREVLLAALSSALEVRLRTLASEPERILEDWKACLVTLGQRVRLSLPGGATVEGDAVDVEADGALVVEIDGERRAFRAGDVTQTRAVD
ncbi:MAG: biotin--[acetyl-CoA-carboxylase] ligase [Dehalococcoidia bacterium]|nr:biotin--[acetyl-CoA-carboxylase] ligase [Dehalococcoidia bacterium]